MNIYLDTINRRCQTETGEQAFGGEIPVFAYSVVAPVLLYLRDGAGQAVAGMLVAGDTATVRIDNTADETDTPCVLAESADVALDTDEQTLAFDADCFTTKFKTAITSKSAKVAAWLGVKIYASGETQPKTAFRVPVYLDNVVYDEAATPPEEPASDYYTKAEVTSLLSGKAESHTNRTDIGRALVDGDNLFVGTGLLAACSRMYTYIAGKLATAYGLLSTANAATLTGGVASDADALHTHPGLADAEHDHDTEYAAISHDHNGDYQPLVDTVATPTGATVLGTVYHLSGGAWVAADPDTPACETCELWMALGSTGAAGMVAQGTVTNPAWSWTTVGALLWLDDSGALTETTPDEITHAGRVARPVGWVRSATSVRFSGHLLGSSYEEIPS